MKLFVQLSSDPIAPLPDAGDSTSGAVITFSGVVRDKEENHPITSLFYEAYHPMAFSGYACHCPRQNRVGGDGEAMHALGLTKTRELLFQNSHSCFWGDVSGGRPSAARGQNQRDFLTNPVSQCAGNLFFFVGDNQRQPYQWRVPLFGKELIPTGNAVSDSAASSTRPRMPKG